MRPELSVIAERYLRFATIEANGVSDTFGAWATGLASDPELLALLEPLPRPKQQPNLVFAAARWTGCPVGGFGDFREWMLAHWPAIEATILARSTQTNEAARCSALIAALAGIEGPVALLEVGASAGLCLYPDRYSYRFAHDGGVAALDPADGTSGVVIPCKVGSGIQAPARLPEVTWRAGIDQSPIDVRDVHEMRWLETLIWPGESERERVDRLHAAARIAAADPPHLRRGDLVDLLASTAEWAPTDATLVVFHSAVLGYLPAEKRKDFRRIVGEVDAVWVSNEAPGVLPDVTARVPADVDVGGRFILARDGRPMALTGAHGQSIEAF